ncbi:hypothetical protein B0H14DRAFT_3132518 [Mycena olivaceomarginata]|nr:hypothetical protein B0H14DRAFT_3132518 [Mycena olivaceomarginata]
MHQKSQCIAKTSYILKTYHVSRYIVTNILGDPNWMWSCGPAEPPAPADSDAPSLPDLEDAAQEAVVNFEPAAKPREPYLTITGSTAKQHKYSILRIFSSRFSVAESRDRLKRVRGFSRHSETGAVDLNSHDTIPGEPMALVGDPAAILVRSNGYMWLALQTDEGYIVKSYSAIF